MIRLLSIVLLVASFGTIAHAADLENVQVTIRGILHEDKNGFFFQIDGMTYDVAFHNDNKADMHKFYSGLEGDLVKITGELHLQEVKDGKPYMVVYTNDIMRLKGERIKVIAVEEHSQPVVIVREHYVEHRHGIHLPFVHINW